MPFTTMFICLRKKVTKFDYCYDWLHDWFRGMNVKGSMKHSMKGMRIYLLHALQCESK